MNFLQALIIIIVDKPIKIETIIFLRASQLVVTANPITAITRQIEMTGLHEKHEKSMEIKTCCSPVEPRAREMKDF